ncbi:hypothetical protein BDV98DRAFT_577573 [Pterulicium gracile]|uniref:Uncharacterized protein n=1 Tax=Pterulicium gracile TaxID=1884261 RepID=A0A5C3Q140_9AGAR|nr:hypothetical protein BDV98DRAFT_577573 [Pterula gracilis]
MTYSSTPRYRGTHSVLLARCDSWPSWNYGAGTNTWIDESIRGRYGGFEGDVLSARDFVVVSVRHQGSEQPQKFSQSVRVVTDMPERTADT